MSLIVIRPRKLSSSSTTRQLLDAVRVQDLLGLLQADARPRGDQIVLGHHLGDRAVEALLEAQVAVGEDADQAAVARHRQAGDVVLPHDLERVGDALLGLDGDGIGDHAALGLLDLLDLAGLRLHRQVPVDEADAALLRHAIAMRDSVTVSIAAEASGMFSWMLRESWVATIGVARHDLALGRDQEDVVEGQAFFELTRVHPRLLRSPFGGTKNTKAPAHAAAYGAWVRLVNGVVSFHVPS